MKLLDDMYQVLHHDLLEINRQCEGLRQDIVEFVTIVSTLPAQMVKLRLTVMTYNIVIQVRNLLKQHHGNGYVFVMMNDTGLGIYWVEKEYSAEDKENFKRHGYLITSPEAMGKVAEQLSEKVDSGELAEAVDWLKRYEPFLRND